MDVYSRNEWTVYHADADDPEDVKRMEDVAVAATDAADVEVRMVDEDETKLTAIRPAPESAGCDGCGEPTSSPSRFGLILSIVEDVLFAVLAGVGLFAVYHVAREGI